MARDNGASASAGSTQLATIGTGNAGAIGQTGASTNNGNAASSQAGKRAFMQLASNRTTASTERVTALASANVVQAGSIIPAALITGIRSDLPGQITAQVTQNVYDSPTGRILLIPKVRG
jgi:type IV secretion system protein VirB10